MAVCRKLSAFAAISLSLSSAVNAQLNEQDRLNRCQNNRQALARLEAVRGNYATEEQIARARTALVAIRRIEAEINRNLARVNELDSLRPTTYWSDINAQRTWPDPRSKIDTEIVAITNANKNLDNQIRSIGASVQFHCANDDLACVLTLSRRLASGIDGAVAQQPLYRQFLQQVEMHKSKLVDLRCDQGPQSETRTITSNSVGIPNVAGSWRGAAYNADYFMSQSGADVTWSSSTRSETASGSFANGVLTMRWNGVNGSGQASGTVISDSNGVATEIRWTNGNVFRRQ